MSTFAEFCLVAFLLFVSESIIWTPLRSVSLLVSLRKKSCQILDPSRWFHTSRVGIVPLSILPGSASFMPCHALPLIVDDDGQWLMQLDDGRFIRMEKLEWSDIECRDQELRIGGRTVKVAGARCWEVMRQAKKNGLTPEQAVRLAWQRSMSLPRAKFEWKKWRMLVEPLLWAQPFLLAWFCFGLVLYSLQGEGFRYVYYLSYLLIIMIAIAARVCWMMNRAYPMCRHEVVMDMIFCCLIPFHGMRMAEICAVKVFANVHPFAMLLHCEPDHPWLEKQLRLLSHPRQDHSVDHILLGAMKSYLALALKKSGINWCDFDQAPRQHEAEETRYCPRCHASYLDHVESCRDCDQYPVRYFGHVGE